MTAGPAPRVVVLGSANMDLVVRQPRRVEAGETMFGTGFHLGAGGKGLNQAIAAARAGASVRFIGRVGADAFGQQLRARLSDDGVDVSALRTAPAPTGVAQITVTDDAENSIVVVPGANAAVDLRDDESRMVAEASHLVVQLERPLDLLVAAMRVARDAGVVTVLTPAPARAGIDDLLELTDILVPNEGEAQLLTGLDDARSAAAVLSRGGTTAIVTLGARGSLVARSGEIVAEVAAPAVTAVDTTAAGDTFVGVLVAWLAAGSPLERGVEAATAAAALSVTRPGAAASMPQREEILRAIGR